MRMISKAISGGLAALALSGCAMLTAQAPLFGPADQDGVFSLAQGLWAHRDSDCALDPAASSPENKDCIDWARITKDADGAWRIEFIGEDDPPLRFVVTPALKAEGGRLARLYVAEATSAKDPEPTYAAIIPRGTLDAPVRRLALHVIDCEPLFREGAPPDITLRLENGTVAACVATTKDAVRAAARRSALEALTDLGDEDLVWVR